MNSYLRIVLTLSFLLLGQTILAMSPSSARGEKIFNNYCSGCHNLLYSNYPASNMPAADAVKWFSVVPPDLSLVTQYRGKVWLRDYLDGFYPDNKRPFGCNNKILPNVQMPNVLIALQSQNDYPQQISDLINFLDYVSNPEREQRLHTGMVVVFLLLLLAVILFLLRKSSD